MLTRSLGVSAALALGLFPFHAAQAQLPKSARLFEQYCITCHGNVQSQQAPDVNALRRIAPEAIYDVLTNRSTHAQARQLADDERRAIAEYLGGRNFMAANAGDAAKMPNACRNNPPITGLSAAPAWN